MYRFLFLFLVLAVFSCAKRELPTDTGVDTSVTLEKFNVPAYINPGKKYTISVKIISQVSFQLINSISLEISKDGDSSIFLSQQLYDDGAAVHPDDNDAVANDGIFSNVLTWEPGSNSRENYQFKFNILSNEELQSDELLETVVSLDNVPPNLLSIEIPEILESGFAQKMFKVEAADSNGIDDVQKVTYQGVRNDTLFFQGELERSTIAAENNLGVVFTQTIDSTFAIAKKGEYKLIFQAKDKSNIKSAALEQTITINNNPPTLWNIVGPAEFERPNGGTDNFLFTVNANDEQSLGDIKFVKLIWQKADGSFSSNSPFTMYDNGLPFNEDFSGWNDGYRGDATADDGIYSITGLFDPSQPLGDYKLTVYSEDFAGNESEHTTFIIKLEDNE